MTKNRSQLLLQEPNLYKAFFILAFPVFGANFLRAFNDLVDTYFIGQIENSVAAQAGVASSWPLINIFSSFQGGLAVAGVAIISQLLGANEKQKACENAGLLFVMAAGLGLVLNVGLYLTAPAVMRAMGATGAALDASVVYLRVRSCEMVFAFVFSAFQAIRQAQGDTLTPVTLSACSILLNIVLTALFVHVLGWGVFGAGFATLLGQVAITPLCLWLLFSPAQPLYLTTQELRVHWRPLRHLVTVALPAAGSQALSSLGFLVLQAVVLSYGDVVTAAFSIGNKVSNILLMPVFAVSSVLAAYIGQNIGAGNPDRARRAYQVSRNMGFWLAVVGSVVLYFFRAEMAALLTNDAQTRVLATEYIFWVLLTQPLLSLFQNYLGAFNGAGRTGYAFWMSTVRLWCIRLPLICWFRAFTDLGSAGVWYAMVLSNLLILVLGMVFYRRVDFKSRVI